MSSTPNHSRNNTGDLDNELNNDLNNDELNSGGSAPSKSARKREMHSLQDMGEKLLDLKSEELASLSLDQTLLEALEVAKKIKAREGRRRQIQYIGKLMRKQGAEAIERIQQSIYTKKSQHQQAVHADKIVESWRNTLLENGDTAIQQLLAEYPQADRNHIRQLVRASKKEMEENRPPASSRKLFRYIKSILA